MSHGRVCVIAGYVGMRRVQHLMGYTSKEMTRTIGGQKLGNCDLRIIKTPNIEPDRSLFWTTLEKQRREILRQPRSE